MRGLFVTGTDTGVGKTCVAALLLAGLRNAGVVAIGMKPVAAGIDSGAAVNADVAVLAAADGADMPLHDRNPYAFAAAIAPHLAARDAGTTIDLAVIEAAYRRLAGRAEVVVVEGAGGALVPLHPGADMLDIAARLAIPVLLVVGVRLGCLNHAALTLQAIRARRLEFAGWIANRIDPAMARADDNVAELASLLGRSPAADCPWGHAAPLSRTTLDKLNLIELSRGAGPGMR
jgi:dethiobiotin synthetase